MTLRPLLDARALRMCLGASAITAVPAAVRGKRMPDPCPPAALPIWLLVGGRDVPAAAGARALGDRLVQLRELGIVVERDGMLHATAAIAVVGHGLVVVDRPETETANRIPWPDDSSMHLVGCLPAGPLARWLDIGTGAAVAPLAAGPRAARVRATDLNPHALARAAQGAALSSRPDLEILPADLLAAAGDTPWDLITFNAPMPSTDTAVPATLWHRSAPGLIERFWATAPAHLAPGGEILVHTALAADPWALHAGRGGALTIARYTPPGEPGFAVTRWRPHAPPSRHLHDIALDRANPYLCRVNVDDPPC